MKKTIFRFWMLAAAMLLGLASCSNKDNPDVPQPLQLADYTIMWYGHGGGNLDMSLMENMMQFYFADEESYKNVHIATQYKFSSLEDMQQLYEQYKELLGHYIEPGTPDYEEALKELEIFKAYYPYAGKTARFVVDREKAFVSGDEDDLAPTEADMRAFLPDENLDITAPESLADFINWAAKECPAHKYILVLSDHGGYLSHDEIPDAATALKTRGVMYDDGHDSRHFTAKSLTQAIRHATVRPSAVYLDACLMNTAEYQFELAPVTDYLVLSTFVVPGEGGSYTDLINALSDNPDNLEQALTRFAKATVDAWDESAAEGADEEKEDPVYHDMSVYRTADIDGTAKINALWQNLKAKQPKGTGINRQSPTYDYEMMRIGKILPKINKEFKAEDTAD